MTAHKIVSFLNGAQRSAEFHEMIYAPHTSVERKCGYDLSVGHYKDVRRVRLMHKLLSGTYKGGIWIDEAWQWSSKSEAHRAKNQIRRLVESYEKTLTLEPFLVLHVCFCVHEYRRMGTTTEAGVTIPAFEDHRRTLIVDLRPIQCLNHWDRILNDPSFELSITCASEDGGAEASISAKAVKMPLDVWPFDKLLAHLVTPDAKEMS